MASESDPLVTVATTTADEEEEEVGHAAKYRNRLKENNIGLNLITVCLCTGSFLAAVDSSIVSTIFNEVGTEFKSSNLASWIFTSYLLSSSCFQPLYAKLSGVFGRKTILVLVNTLFLVGSWCCGAAHSILELSIARAVAGLGGGGLMCMSSVVIHDLVPIRKRGQYQAYVNMFQTFGVAVGAPFGGFLNETVGWRACFYINIPPCLFALYIYIWRLPNYNLEQGEQGGQKWNKVHEQIDIGGACILLLANTCLVVSTSMGGNTHAWSDPVVFIPLGVSGLAFLSFFIFEFFFASNPLLSPAMVKNRNVIASCASNFFLWGTSMSIGYLTPQFFMGVLGHGTASAGLWVMPRAIAVSIGCFLVGRYLGVTGRFKYYLLFTLLADIVAVLTMVLWTPNTNVATELLSLSVEGFAAGTVIVGTIVSVVADVKQGEETASATSMIFLFRSTGLVCGSAISAAIVQGSFKSLLTQSISGPDANEIIEFVRTSVSRIHMLPPELERVVVNALFHSLRRGYIYSFICTVLSFLSVAVMKNTLLNNKD